MKTLEKEDFRYVNLDYRTEAFIICGEPKNGEKVYLAYCYNTGEYIWVFNSFDAKLYNSIEKLKVGLNIAKDLTPNRFKVIKSQLVTIIDSNLFPRIELNHDNKENETNE